MNLDISLLGTAIVVAVASRAAHSLACSNRLLALKCGAHHVMTILVLYNETKSWLVLNTSITI